MSEDERRRIKRKNETRTEDISRMIDEGGLGADKYYDIVKKKSGNDDTSGDDSEKKGEQDE